MRFSDIEYVKNTKQFLGLCRILPFFDIRSGSGKQAAGYPESGHMFNARKIKKKLLFSKVNYYMCRISGQISGIRWWDQILIRRPNFRSGRTLNFTFTNTWKSEEAGKVVGRGWESIALLLWICFTLGGCYSLWQTGCCLQQPERRWQLEGQDQGWQQADADDAALVVLRNTTGRGLLDWGSTVEIFVYAGGLCWLQFHTIYRLIDELIDERFNAKLSV